MTRRVLFALSCCAFLLLGSAVAHAQTTSPEATPSESESATETPTESASPTASPSETTTDLPTPEAEPSEAESPSPSDSPTEEETTSADACPPEDGASEQPNEETPGEEATPPASPPAAPTDPEATTAQEGEPECASPSPSPSAMAIEAGSRPDEGGEGADATAVDSAFDAGLDSAGPVPSRVDAGGGHLARAREDAGLNWLLLVPLLVGAIVLAPRVRARAGR